MNYTEQERLLIVAQLKRIAEGGAPLDAAFGLCYNTAEAAGLTTCVAVRNRHYATMSKAFKRFGLHFLDPIGDGDVDDGGMYTGERGIRRRHLAGLLAVYFEDERHLA